MNGNTNIDRYLLIGRGHAGWHASGIDRQGNSISSSGGKLTDYCAAAPDDTPVYDADLAGDSFSDFVIRGPMVDCTLAPGEVRRFGQRGRAAMLGMLPALEGGFRTIATIASSALSSLDYVSIDCYIQLLSEIPGVRFGSVQKGLPQWP